ILEPQRSWGQKPISPAVFVHPHIHVLVLVDWDYYSISLLLVLGMGQHSTHSRNQTPLKFISCPISFKA
ncbi:hypothetical protein, partial [Helicobacter ailurogastricus]|uniref:hypothetical protein n=1 Tax=Helicobacter ailurogastricus TaxID=1578720 RepID=UPI001E2C7155